MIHKGMLARQRFGLEDIKARSNEVPFVQQGEQIVLHQHRSPTDVDQHGAGGQLL